MRSKDERELNPLFAIGWVQLQLTCQSTVAEKSFARVTLEDRQTRTVPVSGRVLGLLILIESFKLSTSPAAFLFLSCQKLACPKSTSLSCAPVWRVTEQNG